MAGWADLAREHEERRFPLIRRLDVHAEGPGTARDRALRWIQSYAHEEPGQELLVIVERGGVRGRARGPVRSAVEGLLSDLEGKLIDWWEVFGDGGLALRISDRPDIHAATAEPVPRPDPDDGRTPETSGTALLALEHDIPPELEDLALRAAELRRTREGISVGLLDVVLRRIWIEAQADAMESRIGFDTALHRILADEQAREPED
jgi:hypothetical protein